MTSERPASPDTRSATVGTRTGKLAEPQALQGEMPCLDSESLLQGRGSVAISHRGTIYRLQATRQGKLILTK